MSKITTEDLGHGVAYCYGPNGMTAWVVVDGRKIGEAYRGETAWMDAERVAMDLVLERAHH